MKTIGSGAEKKKARNSGRGSSAPQVISLSAPPLADLPEWGPRIEFDNFFVELVAPGDRVFNVRLSETFASINFAPAEGTSSLAGDRLRSYDRRPYEFIVVPPRFPLSGETKSAPEVLGFFIRFDLMRQTIAQGLGVPAEALNPEVVIGDPTTFTNLLANRIRLQFSTTVPPHGYLESLCIALIVEMFRPIAERPTPKPRQQVDKKRLDMLLKYIDANLDGDLAVDRLAELIGVSADQLSRSFKTAVGDSPHNYVIQRRTDTAKQLLVNDDYSLSDIAYATGFSSQSHMTTAFKKVLGVTPGAVRKQD